VFGQKGIDFVLSHLSIRSLSACLFLFSLSRRNGGSIGRLWWACGNGWVERGHFFSPLFALLILLGPNSSRQKKQTFLFVFGVFWGFFL
jgi:hypothetical protein